MSKDQQVEAANEIYMVARQQADEEIARLKGEIEAIREESQALGVLKKIEYDIAHNQMLKYVVLHRIKAAKEYRKGGMTWAQFCEAIGDQVRRVDEVLKDIQPVIQQFSAESADLLGFELSKIRYLGRAISAESADFEDGMLIVDDQKIALTPENRDEIEALIDGLKSSAETAKNDANAALKAKDRILKSKEDVINRQEKELARHESRAQKQGYAPGEEAFLQQMENARTTVDGYLLKFDPDINPLPEDATERMMAAYVTTLSYFKRVMDEAYAVASERYGHAELDDGWVPPNLRVVNNDDGE